LEDFVARVDAPLLDSLHIRFFHQLIFNTPQLAQFLARTPNIQPPVEALISFTDHGVEVRSPPTFPGKFVLGTSCRQLDWQLLFLSQVCSSSLPDAFISTAEHLYIHGFQLPSQNDIEDSHWVDVLQSFTAVKYLYLTQGFAPYIAPTLQEPAGGVLPSLQELFLDDVYRSEHVQKAIEKFVTTRRLAGHPIAVSVSEWDSKPYV